LRQGTGQNKGELGYNKDMDTKPIKTERRAAQRQKARSKKGMRSAGKWYKSSYREAVTKRLAATKAGEEPRPGQTRG